MSKTQEAIKLLKELKFHWLTFMEAGEYEASEGEKLDKALSLLESEPEPNEFTKKWRDVLNPETMQRTQHIPFVCVSDILEACNKIDSLTAANRLAQQHIEHLKLRIKELEPKPLLFGNLDSFKVIISESVPENQIWFASKEQLNEALEYSMRFIEKKLEGQQP